MIFDFQLKHIEDIQPWGEFPNKNLHWFGFTDGKYRLKIGDEFLLNYSEEYKEYCSEKFPDYTFETTFVEYQVVRLWEDTLELFSDIVESKSRETKHFLDAGYLTNPPKIWFRVDGKDLIINWDNRKIKVEEIPVWSAIQGNYRISKKDFIEEVQRFDKSFIAQMNERVEKVCQTWKNQGIKVDFEQLKNEQKSRATWLDLILR